MIERRLEYDQPWIMAARKFREEEIFGFKVEFRDECPKDELWMESRGADGQPLSRVKLKWREL